MNEIPGLATLAPYLKPASIALAVLAIVWGFVEYLMFWAPERWRRLVAALLGQGLLFYVHESNLYSFGAGPEGWALVLVVGVLAAPLAATFHDQVINRWAPWAKAPVVAAAIVSAVKPKSDP